MSFSDRDRQREYQRQWVAARRAKFFADKCCVQCGSTDRLELDHIDPSTKVTHSIWSWSEKRRLDEIAKCQVLCYECHLAKTVAARAKDFPHGHIRRYRTYGCKCDLCKAAEAALARQKRLRKKLARAGQAGF